MQEQKPIFFARQRISKQFTPSRQCWRLFSPLAKVRLTPDKGRRQSIWRFFAVSRNTPFCVGKSNPFCEIIAQIQQWKNRLAHPPPTQFACLIGLAEQFTLTFHSSDVDKLRQTHLFNRTPPNHPIDALPPHFNVFALLEQRICSLFRRNGRNSCRSMNLPDYATQRGKFNSQPVRKSP